MTIYLTYPEYTELGGVLDLSAFNKTNVRAYKIIDGYTDGRISDEIPEEAKHLCRDLIEYLYRETIENHASNIKSQSQSMGGVSESISYEVKNTEEINRDVEGIILDYLGGMFTQSGVPVLYWGALR